MASPAASVDAKLSIRGPLRYQITTSSPQIEAGTRFSIYVRITNPYDVPVTISSVRTILPVEFVDVATLERDFRRQTLVYQLRLLEQQPSKSKLGWLPRKPKEEETPQVSGQYVSSVPNTYKLVSESDIGRIVDSVQISADQQTAKTDAARQLRDMLGDLEEPVLTETILQPGNSVINIFTLKTNRSIFFPPNVYQSSIRIEYTIDGSHNIDVADYQLNVRAPLKAIIYGALTGSLFGFVLKDLVSSNQVMATIISEGFHSQKIVPYLLSLISAMMIAGIVVVAFARKKDAQPILSVEDFWGGIFVGFLAGYTGQSFLDQAIPKTGVPLPAATPK